MASEVDICNLALAHLGDKASISAIVPPDGSAQAAHCARFYPIVRDAILEMHNWKFAITRANLALLDTDETPAEWAYAYACPNSIKVVSVNLPDAIVAASSRAVFEQTEFLNRIPTQPFTIESLADGSLAVYTNVENAAVMFIRRVTDTSKFSPLFVIAASRLLAAYIAGPIIKGEAGMKVARAHMEWFEKIDNPRAKSADASASRNLSYDTFTPGGIAARS